MKKIYILSCLFLFVTGFEKVLAQNDSLPEMYLEDLLIEENRLKIPFTISSRSISVLEAEELETLPVQSISGALGFVPGVDVRRRGAMGVQADLSIRGGTFEQSLVLLNGIKLTDPQTGHHMLNLPLNLDNVERIVILKGPGARAFGQNAFAGAINIITRIPEDRKISIANYYGSFNSYGITASLALPDEKYGQYVSFSRDASDGYRYNTDYSINNLFYQSELKVGARSTLQVQGGYTDREFGANGFYASPDANEQWETIQTGLLSLSYNTRFNKAVELKARAYWRRNDDEYLFVRGQPEIYQNIHQTNVLGGEVNSTIEGKLGTSGFGMEWREEVIESTNLGDWQRSNFGVFAEHHFRLGKFDVTPGLYVNWYSDFGWNAFPGIDAGLLVTPKTRLFASVGRSFRIPTYTDLYYEDPANLGNENLEPENAMSYEAGFRYTDSFLYLQASYFIRNSNNLIDWIKETEESRWEPRNFTGLQVSGLEFSVEADPSLLEKSSPFTHLSLSYTWIDANLDEAQNVTSRYVLENVRHQLTGRANYRFLKSFSHSVAARFLDRVTLDNYWLVDTRLTWQQNNVKLFAEVANVFDKDYTEVNLVPMPGRWFRAGLNIDVNF